MPNIGPLEIAIVVFLIFLIFGPRGIKKLANRGGKRIKETGNAALEAGKGAKESFEAPATGEGAAAEAGRAARTAGEKTLEAGKGLKAGLTGEADEPLPETGVAAIAHKAGERVRASGEAVVDSGREFRDGLGAGDDTPDGAGDEAGAPGDAPAPPREPA